MKMFFSQEYQAIKSFLKDNFQVLVVLCLVTFSLVMQWYRPVGSTLTINYLFYYVVLPVLVILFVLRDNPLDYGFRIGRFSTWLTYVFMTIMIGFPVFEWELF